MKAFTEGVARTASAVFLSVAVLGAAHAAPTDTAFAPTVRLNSTTLVLNGKGTRHRAVFRVYDMALYLSRKVKSVDDVLALPGPKQIDFTAMRELDTTEVGLAFVRGMRANASSDQMTRHLAASSRLIEIFSSRSKLAAGERFGLQFIPGKGTLFMLNGEQQGAPLGDDEFFRMMLKIWLGDSPAEPLLKDALLGD